MDLQAYEFLASAVLLVDHAGCIRHANSPAQVLFALSAKQLCTMSGCDLLNADPALRSRFGGVISGKFGVLRQDIVVRRQADTVLASLTIVPMEGGPWAALLELRALEPYLLLDRTQQLSKELAAQRESLRNLAHEVKNPLGGLRGAAQLLDAELDTEELRDYTRVIMAEADRLTALIDRLIAPQSEGLRKTRLNIHEVCERVYTLLQAEFAPQVHVDRDYDTSVPELDADFSRLVQVLLNMARNAAQSVSESANGGPDLGTVVLRTRIGRQLILADRPVRMGLVVSIIDNGPGIPPGIRDKVFHPLVTGRTNGTGLGLSLAQEYAQQHGGLVEFDSWPGHTEFRLILPLEQA